MTQCNRCKGHGYLKFIPIDGSTIYKWMKYETKPCPDCNGRGVV